MNNVITIQKVDTVREFGVIVILIAAVFCAYLFYTIVLFDLKKTRLKKIVAMIERDKKRIIRDQKRRERDEEVRGVQSSEQRTVFDWDEEEEE